MNKYNRYFKITTGPMIEAVENARKVNSDAQKEYLKILEDIGAGSTYFQRDNRLVAITFESPPDSKVFKVVNSGWYPKQNCKAGKEIHKRFKSIKTINDDDALSTIGLSSSPTIFTAGKCYFPTLTIMRSDPIACYVSLPWYDEDPKVIAEYKASKDDSGFDRDIEPLLYEPTKDMIEMKEWEVIKEFDEWNALVAG